MMQAALQPAVTNLRASWILPDGYDVIYTPEHIAPMFDGDRLSLYAILARRKDLEATSNGKRSQRSSTNSVKEFWFEVRNILNSWLTFAVPMRKQEIIASKMCRN